MTSVCYLIVCVNFLYSFDQGESNTEIWQLGKEEQEYLLNSITGENQDEYLAKKFTPYWKLTYDEQLQKKQNTCSVIVDMIVNRSDSLKNLMTYKILPIVPSPVIKAYRNKDDFFIRHGVDGNPKTVGCLFGRHTLGKIFSVRPTKIVTIKDSHKRVAQVYEDFIRVSPIAASLKPNDYGHWNTLFVRSNEAGDVMVSVTVKPSGYPYKTIQKQKQVLKGYFFKHLPNITLFHQVCRNKKCTHDESPFILLYGKPYLIETLNGYKFHLSPDSIFPINKLGTEVLYKTIIRSAKLKPNTTILDLCSSTVINSIMLSKFVEEAVVFEYFPQAITEVENVAQFNNIHNVKFLLGRINDNLNSVLESLNVSTEVTVILNHRLTLLGRDVIETIRRSFQITKLVYISYKPNSKNSVQNFVDLCSTRYWKAPPFRLVKVIPVDQFPQTPYVELILIFQREPV